MEMEPWMRNTYLELDPVRRGVVHALELAEEDVLRWCGDFGDEAMFAHPAGLPPVAFHLRHIARSLDRLLTYAEGQVLDEAQRALLGSEMAEGGAAEVLREFREGIAAAKARVKASNPQSYGESRGIGRRRLPTTVAGLLIHCAEHTSRHVGQAVTSAKVVAGTRFA